MNTLHVLCCIFAITVLSPFLANATWNCNVKYGLTNISDATVEFSARRKQSDNYEGCIYESLEMREGLYYFTFDIHYSDEVIQVGVANDKEFAGLSNEKYKGCFYSHSLHYGREYITLGFGEHLDVKVSPDKMEVVVNITSKKMDVYLIHRGLPLGLAFSIKNPPLPFYPAILLEQNGKVTITEHDNFSDESKLKRSNRILDGKYEIKSLKINSTETKAIKCSAMEKSVEILQIFGDNFVSRNDKEFDEFSILFNGDKNSALIYARNNEWRFFETNGNDDWRKSKCLRFFYSVFEKMKSFQRLSDSLLKISSKDGKSVELKLLKRTNFKPITNYN